MLDVHRTTEGDREIVWVSTTVVTPDVLDAIDRAIEEASADCLVLDYDETRWRWLEVLGGEAELDLVQVIRAGEMSQLNARLAMGVLAKSLAPRSGVGEDAEYVRARAAARRLDIGIVFGRRRAEVEAVRAWRRCTVGGRFGYAWRLLKGSLRRTQLEPEQAAEPFDPQAAWQAAHACAGQAAPVLFDEAATWLAAKIRSADAPRVVVFGSLASRDAVISALGAPRDTDGLDHVPEKSLFSRAVPWIFTGLIIAAFVLGFVFADPEKMHQAAVAWFASNMTFAAIGAALALAHPLTVVATSISAPFVSLNPAVGAGMVGALVQAFVAPPTVRDMDRVGDDITRITGWWKNRLARLVLIFVFANVFSSIGSFAAFAWFPT